MQEKNHKRARKTEVFSGLWLILVAFSYITSLLLNFNFVSPYATLQEDLVYLSENTQNQMVSSVSWLVTALITFTGILFYLLIFRKGIRVLHYLNGIIMLFASVAFLMMAMTGLELYREMVGVVGEGLEQAGEQVKLSLLERYRLEQLFRHIGSSCVGVWAVGLGLSGVRNRRFPLLSTVLLLVSGPVLVFFNWFNPEHLARTMAMAGIIIGVMIFCVRLINKGLSAS